MDEYSEYEINQLIKVSKKLDTPNQLIDLKEKKNKVILHSVFNQKHKFMLEITSGLKFHGKASIHSLELKHREGLIRLDFKGRHTNPDNIDENVPKELIKYKSKVFNLDEPHLHVYVKGYGIRWAIPIQETQFKDCVFSKKDDLGYILSKFAKELNISDELNIQTSLL